MFKTTENVDEFFSKFSQNLEGDTVDIQYSAFIQSQSDAWRSVFDLIGKRHVIEGMKQRSENFDKFFKIDKNNKAITGVIPIIKTINSSYQLRECDPDVVKYFYECVIFYMMKIIAEYAVNIQNQNQNQNPFYSQDVRAPEIASLIYVLAPSRSYTDILRKGEKIGSIIDDWNKKFADLEISYREKIKIDTTISYWENKIKEYNFSNIKFSIAFYLFCFIPTIICVILFVTKNIPSVEQIVKLSSVVYLIVVVMGIMSVPYFWILRRLSYSIVNSLKLKNDAQYRSSVINSFLTLNSEEKTKLSETERAIFLNALFRPLDAMEREDVTPPSFVDLIKPKTT